MILRSLRTSILILALPVSELFFFRWFLHSVLNLRFGLPGFVDNDLILPGFFAFTVWIFLLSQDSPLRMSVQRTTLTAHCLLLFFFTIWNLDFSSLEWILGFSVAITVWITLLASMVVTGLFAFVPISAILANRNRITVFPCTLIALSVAVLKNLYTATWPWFGALSAQSSCTILKTLESKTTCFWQNPYYLHIRFPGIRAYVGPPCSGLDALMLFLVAFGIFTAFQGNRLRVLRATGYFLAGIAFTFGLNVVRIVGIFMMSHWLNRLYPARRIGLEVFVEFFHLHMGWLLYVPAISGLFLLYAYVDGLLEKRAELGNDLSMSPTLVPAQD